MPAITVKVDTRKWKKKIKNYRFKVHTRLDAEIKATALDIDREAKKNVRVDTGRLRASIHPQYKGTSGFQYSGRFGFFDGMIRVTLKVFEAIVGTNVQYAKKIEKKYPFLEPAARLAAINFRRRLSKIFKR